MDISNYYNDKDISKNSIRRCKWISLSIENPDFSKSDKVTYSCYINFKNNWQKILILVIL